MKDKLIIYEFMIYRFMMSIEECTEKFIERDILSCKRGDIFEN